MNELISVCVPTYNRPEFLAVALRSVVEQGYRPLELLIGDDSSDDLSASIVHGLRRDPGVDVHYVRNQPALGQNRNVDALLRKVSGDRLLLLHDDDALLPSAVEILAACWDKSPDTTIAFGKQEVITHAGVPSSKGSDAVNRDYYRTRDRAGRLKSTFEAALLQQIPNNSFLVRSDAARAVGYRDADVVGTACDLDFTLRLGLRYDRDQAYFVDAFVSRYRYSEESVSSNPELRRSEQPRSGLLMFRFVRSLPVPPELEYARAVLLQRLTRKAVKSLALTGARMTALQLYLSRSYPWSSRFSPGGLYHLALIASPGLDRLRRYR